MSASGAHEANDGPSTNTGLSLPRLSLNHLPDDVLLIVFSLVDADTVLSLLQVSRRFQGFKDSYTVWHNAHVNLLHRARYIDLQALDQKPIDDVGGRSLRQSILQTTSAEKNWLSNNPKAVGPPRIVHFDTQPVGVSLDQTGYITKFTSKHMLVPMSDGTLMGYDLDADAQAGRHAMDQDSILIDLAQVEDSRSLMGLTGKVAVVRVEESFGMHIRLAALRIDVPGPNDAQVINFEPLKKVTLLLPFSSEVHILDASRKMICAAFSIMNSLSMGILLVFDWDKEEAGMFDTGIPYQYGRSLVGMQLSSDGDLLMIDSELNGKSIRHTFDLRLITRSHATWNAVDFQPESVTEPVESKVHVWKNDPAVLSNASTTNPYLFWELNQLPKPPFGIPSRVSTVILYVTLPRNVDDAREDEKIWRIAQHYTDENGPCAESRTIATLQKPVMGPSDADEHGMPLVCLSFNQFGWVTEEVIDEGKDIAFQQDLGPDVVVSFGERKRKVLKLMTFPDPGETFDGDLASTARTLDIPSEVLDNAYHIVLDSTQGLVLVGTLSNTLQIYRYSQE